jgi:uncharacterized membrane protein YphA (DoxX/SURF4 family)
MNVLLWIAQILLALLSIAGGAYKVLGYEQLAQMPFGSALPQGGWAALGIFEVVCGILLLIPAAKRRLTPLAATALVIESIALAVIYSRYSMELIEQNPLVWVVLMTVMALFVAIGRFARR